MKSLKELYKNLEGYSNFEKDGNPEKFLETVDTIVAYRDPSSIKELLQYFDDETEYGWVLESTIRSLENFEDDVYVAEMLKNLDLLLKRAPGFVAVIFARIINNPNSFTILKSMRYLISQEIWMNLSNIINQSFSDNQELILKLKQI